MMGMIVLPLMMQAAHEVSTVDPRIVDETADLDDDTAAFAYV